MSESTLYEFPDFAEFHEKYQDSEDIYSRDLCPNLLAEFFNISRFDAIELFGRYSVWLTKKQNAGSSSEPLSYVHPEAGTIPYPDNRM